jgi:hypothetical protein
MVFGMGSLTVVPVENRRVERCGRISSEWVAGVIPKAVAARQDQNRVGTSNFFGQSLGQFFRVFFFFLTLHQFNGGDGYNAYYYKGET